MTTTFTVTFFQYWFRNHVIFATYNLRLLTLHQPDLHALLKTCRNHAFHQFPAETYRTDLRRSANTKFDNKDSSSSNKFWIQRKEIRNYYCDKLSSEVADLLWIKSFHTYSLSRRRDPIPSIRLMTCKGAWSIYPVKFRYIENRKIFQNDTWILVVKYILMHPCFFSLVSYIFQSFLKRLKKTRSIRKMFSKLAQRKQLLSITLFCTVHVASLYNAFGWNSINHWICSRDWYVIIVNTLFSFASFLKCTENVLWINFLQIWMSGTNFVRLWKTTF